MDLRLSPFFVHNFDTKHLVMGETYYFHNCTNCKTYTFMVSSSYYKRKTDEIIYTTVHSDVTLNQPDHYLKSFAVTYYDYAFDQTTIESLLAPEELFHLKLSGSKTDIFLSWADKMGLILDKSELT